MEFYGLEQPSDNIFDVLLHIAKTQKKIKLLKGFDNSIKKVYDIDAVAHRMVKNFFDGHLGRAMLDDEFLNENF